MDYEKAKQLKDAGFPQKGNAFSTKIENGVLVSNFGRGIIYGGTSYDENDEPYETEEVYAPTLEELIEACGDNINVLERHQFYNWDTKETLGGWKCGVYDGAMYEGVWLDESKPNGKGKTPSEAVANLWLALNKK